MVRSEVQLKSPALGEFFMQLQLCYIHATPIHTIFFFSELYINPKRPIEREVTSHRWTKSNILTFETSSNSGYPKALSLKLSTVSRNIDTRDDINMFDDDMGCAFVDLTPIWKKVNASSNNPSVNCSTEVFLFNESEELFDQHGTNERSSDEVKVSVYTVEYELAQRKRMDRLKLFTLHNEGRDSNQNQRRSCASRLTPAKTSSFI